MNKFATSMSLAGILLLAACGGGGGGSTALTQSGGNGIAVGEPAPGAPAKDDFIKMARSADCADHSNRLYIIDGKQVFWERAGNCADASYNYALYGLTPQNQQCWTGDTIAGPRTTCQDETQRALMETITRNLDKPDLGTGRKVELVAFMPKEGPVPYEKLSSELYSGVQSAQNLVLRDAESFLKFWNTVHQVRVPAPDAPKIDFTRKMVLAVAAGPYPNGCYGLGLEKVAVSGETMVVSYRISTPKPEAICTQAIVSPVAMIVVDKADGKVEFTGS